MDTSTMTETLKPLKVERNYNPDRYETPVYDIQAPSTLWRIRKEFYANGPSLYTWVVYRCTTCGASPSWVAEFRTKKAAVAFVQKKEGRDVNKVLNPGQADLAAREAAEYRAVKQAKAEAALVEIEKCLNRAQAALNRAKGILAAGDLGPSSPLWFTQSVEDAKLHLTIAREEWEGSQS